jgi:hypothetical protein
MSLPQAVKTMLQDMTEVTNANITYGTRNQGHALPAVTFTIQDHSTLTVGSTPMRKCTVLFQSIAATAEDAQELAMDLEDELDAGTYNSVDFVQVINKNSMLLEASSGHGEETMPFICQTQADIYYTL